METRPTLPSVTRTALPFLLVAVAILVTTLALLSTLNEEVPGAPTVAVPAVPSPQEEGCPRVAAAPSTEVRPDIPDDVRRRMDRTRAERGSRRLRAIEALGYRRGDARYLLPYLEKMVESPHRGEACAAMVAIMRLRGNREYLLRLAEEAALRSSTVASVALRKFDGDHARVLMRAVQKKATLPADADAARRLDQFIEALVARPEKGVQILSDRLRVEPGSDPRMWVDIACDLKPFPSRLGACLRDMLRSDRSDLADHVRGLLGRKSVDWSGVVPSLEGELLRRYPSHQGAEHGEVLTLIGRAGKPSEEALRAMVAAVAAGGKARDGALRGLEASHGAVGVVVPDLIDLARSSDPAGRRRILECLTRAGPPECVPYLKTVLTTGTDFERVIVLENLQRVRDANLCMNVLVDLVSGSSDEVSCMALHAAATTDRGLASSLTTETILLGCRDPRPQVRKAALKAVRWLKQVPDSVTVATRASLKDEDPGVRRVAKFLSAYLRNPRYSTSRSLLRAN